MPPLSGSPVQVESLISYLRTLSVPQSLGQPAETLAHEEAPAPESRPIAAASLVAVAASPSTPGENVVHDVSVPPTAGRELFRSQGCIACHGFNAQGTQLAPSLMGVATRFPGDRLPALLHHPTRKMREGGMPAVAIDDVQMGELVGYLSSLQPVPATPSTGAQADQASAEPRLAASQASNQSSGQTAQVRGESHVPLDQLAMRGKIVFQRNACGTCHGVDGLHGTVAAPGLAGTASLLPESALENLLRHHTTRMQKGGMPNTNFSQQDMKAIVAYIRSMSSNTEEHKLLASGYANRKN